MTFIGRHCWFLYKTDLQKKYGRIVGYFSDFELKVYCEDTGKYHVVELNKMDLI